MGPEDANFDYRDIITLSEYPSYSKYAFETQLSAERKIQLINAEWKQYENWLKKKMIL